MNASAFVDRRSLMIRSPSSSVAMGVISAKLDGGSGNIRRLAAAVALGGRRRENACLPDGATCSKVAAGAGQAIARGATCGRKVRAPAGRVPGNAWEARAYGKCHRKHTAYGPSGPGKGEKVR